MEESNLIKEITKFTDEYCRDIEFDEFTQGEFLMKIPSLKAKWSTYLSVHEAEVKQMKSDRDDLINTYANTIIEKSLKPISKNAADNLAKKSEKYVKHNNKIKEMETIVIHLDRLNTNMQSLTWEMKNFIDWQKKETI